MVRRVAGGQGMRRREFITLIGGVAASWPLAGHTQSAEPVRWIGMLIGTFAKADREGQDRIAAFLDTFQKLGWSDGRNFRMDFYWGQWNQSRTAPSEKFQPLGTSAPFAGGFNKSFLSSS